MNIGGQATSSAAEPYVTEAMATRTIEAPRETAQSERRVQSKESGYPSSMARTPRIYGERSSSGSSPQATFGWQSCPRTVNEVLFFIGDRSGAWDIRPPIAG